MGNFFNLPNTISLSRLIPLGVSILFLLQENMILKNIAIILCIITMISDFADGWAARKFNQVTKFGSVMDVMVDRIIENVYWVSLAILGIFPLWAPILVILRVFSTDAVRSVASKKGHTTFSMMESKLGKLLVSSRASRGIYSTAKTATFALGMYQFVYGDPSLNLPIYALVIFTVLFALVRGALTIWDSRKFLE